ncbi:MAG: class I SAM-dependent methyltransferase [Acidobacteria bacterium]|nr:class I SAM-dependent methyltransferase [Acidobacteriota bacterium]
MNRSLSTRCLILALGFAFLVYCIPLRAQEQGDYQPHVGQPGKDVVWVPTSESLVEKMLDLAKVTPRDYLIDLGSGDGRTVIAAAKRGVTALGIEFNPDMVELSKRNAAAAGVSDRATFAKADLFESDFSKATVITMFLLPDINLKLRPKLLGLKPGTRIVSNSFTMEDWQADDTANADEECQTWCTAYLWIIPANADGKWRLPNGELTINQKLQNFTGTITSGEKSTEIAGKIVGDTLSFKVGDAFYSGQINGDTISGTINQMIGDGRWSATREKQGVPVVGIR